MTKGYIILSVNGKKVKTPSDVRQFTNNEKTLKSIGGIQSDGTIFRLPVRKLINLIYISYCFSGDL